MQLQYSCHEGVNLLTRRTANYKKLRNKLSHKKEQKIPYSCR